MGHWPGAWTRCLSVLTLHMLWVAVSGDSQFVQMSQGSRVFVRLVGFPESGPRTNGDC